MRISLNARTIALTLAAVAAAGACWVFLAPRQIGGGVDYAVIHGVSMQPKLHAGDLAIIRREPSYAVGQVVAYQSGLLHEVVLHRIIGVKHGHYVFKGDNNNFTDSYFPTQHALIGRLWLRIPYAGGLLAWLRSPGRAAVLGGLVALLMIAGGGTAGVRRRDRRAPRTPGLEPRPHSKHVTVPAQRRPLLVGALAVAAAFATVAALGFAHSGRRLVDDPSGYAQTATYSYRATAHRSTVYPRGLVATGDPVYLNLVHRLGLTLHYRFATRFPHAISGTIALQAILRSGGGWVQRLGAAPVRAFRGDTAHAEVAIDLAQLAAKMRAFRSEADVVNETFVLAVASHVVLHGIVNGRPVTETFVPAPLTFNTDDQSVELAQAPSSSATVGAPAPDPLRTTTLGTVERRQPASLSLHGLTMSARGAREIGLAGAVAALAVALAALVPRRRRPLDELASIKRRCGSWLVPISSPLVGSAIDIASIDSLVDLAKHYDSPILYEQRDHVHVFAVADMGRLYRFQFAAAPEPEARQQPVIESRWPVDDARHGPRSLVF